MSPEANAADGEQSLGMVLKRAEQSLLRAKSAALKPVGLSLAQYVALAELDERPGSTGSDLARACLVTPQAMMVVLKALEEQGLVVRSPHERHRNVLEVHLTEPGREALHTARAHVGPVEQRFLTAMSPDEQNTLRELLLRCIDATDR
jgi:DNA-binding MarR family transcriptional regulator